MTCLIAIGVITFVKMPSVFEHIQAFDNSVLISLAQIRTPKLNQVMLELTSLGSVKVLIPLSLIFAVLFYLRKDRSGLLNLLLAGVGALLWPELLKEIFERPRPSIVEHLAHASGSSFPSGHALGATTIYLTMAYLAHKSRARRKVFFALASSVILAVGFSRMYLGVHYPSDVVAGFACGVIWSLSAAVLTKAIAKPKPGTT